MSITQYNDIEDNILYLICVESRETVKSVLNGNVCQDEWSVLSNHVRMEQGKRIREGAHADGIHSKHDGHSKHDSFEFLEILMLGFFCS